MVGTIIPVVYGDRKNGSRILGFHITGYILGASLLGGILGSLGLLLNELAGHEGRSGVTAIIGGISLFLGAREFGLIAFPLPQIRWQVPAKWRSLPLNAMPIIYGLVLGIGVTTRITMSTFHVVIVWAVLSGKPLLAAFVISGFGLGRAIPFIWITHGSETFRECFAVVERMDNLLPLVHALNGLGLAFVGSCLLSTWLELLVIGGRYGAH
jgi:cytochrome c biogenesis protein CcdA